MRLLLFVVIMVHGLIHLMGFAKAFEYAELSQLTQRISRPVGLLWLAAAVAFVAAGVLFILRPEAWWWVGAPAVVLSQALIFASWRDAPWTRFRPADWSWFMTFWSTTTAKDRLLPPGICWRASWTIFMLCV